MTWKRNVAIALCSGVLWLYADRAAQADEPKEDKAPPAHSSPDAGPRDDDFGPPGPPGGEAYPPGPRPGFGGPDMQGPQPGQAGRAPGGMRGYGRGFGGYGGYGGMMMRNDPDLVKEAELDRKVQSLAERYRNDDENMDPNAPKANRAELQKEIKKLVIEQFDLRQKRRENELKRMEEQIKRLRETIERRQNARDEIIDRYIKALLDQEDEMQF